ncbi:MAG: L,D-transpeptidase family protein [Hyphomicrobiaceae bacterium]|nr:L,D-transpeptidase family protein [Hyphomicrobiaceae bacterium]
MRAQEDKCPQTCSCGYRWGLRGLAVALLIASAGSAAHAYDGNSWLRFGPVGDSGTFPQSNTSTAYDRQFIREWEANPPRGYPTLSPANIEATKHAITRYEEIVKAGGWKQLGATELQAGMNGKAVAELIERLHISGHLREKNDYPEHFGYELENAVKRFQATNGLTPTGVVDKRTLAALNVPAAGRLKQLKQGLSRLREYAGSLGKKKYIVVNIPAAQIEAVDDDHVVTRHTGVVGKPERKTPLLRSAIYELNFNPVWRLPPTVITQDLIPKGRQMQSSGKNVLVKYGIDAYDGSGRKLDPEKIKWNSSQPMGLSYSQQPGKDNPLGFLKINFNNDHSVYMHDTPSESLFGRNFRAASSGCIRVSNIEKLAAWILEDQGVTAADIQSMKKTGERKDVRVKKPVPLYFVYITAWATEDGVIQFRRDLYNKDGVGDTASNY